LLFLAKQKSFHSSFNREDILYLFT
jgi:hypothetical protein